MRAAPSPSWQKPRCLGAVPADTAAAPSREVLSGPVGARLVMAFPWWASQRDNAPPRNLAAARGESFGAVAPLQQRTECCLRSARSRRGVIWRSPGSTVPRRSSVSPPFKPALSPSHFDQATDTGAASGRAAAGSGGLADAARRTRSRPTPAAPSTVIWSLLRGFLANGSVSSNERFSHKTVCRPRVHVAERRSRASA